MHLVSLILVLFLIALVFPGLLMRVSKKQSSCVKVLLYVAIAVVFGMCINKYIFKNNDGFYDTAPDPNVVTEGARAPNMNLVFNKGGPAWGQWVVRPTLIPKKITMYDQTDSDGTQRGKPFYAGNIKITPILRGKTRNYDDIYSYFLGDMVAFNDGNWYINLSWTDKRGLDYSGSYQSSPSKDKNVWKLVGLNVIPPLPASS